MPKKFFQRTVVVPWACVKLHHHNYYTSGAIIH